ncbi:MAG: hypothetical protein K2L78_00310, partial [Muribaculaceae bacterium]|nr:hypothetical protein [Muribaculaceae bacterium]
MTGEKDIREEIAEPADSGEIAEGLKPNLLKSAETADIKGLYRDLLRNTREVAENGDSSRLRSLLKSGVENGHFHRDKFGNSAFVRSMSTAIALCNRVGPDRNMV